MRMLRKPGNDVTVIHAPAVRIPEVLTDLVAGERCRGTELVVALRIEIEMVDAEQERIERLPAIAQRAHLEDRISHLPTLQYVCHDTLAQAIHRRYGRSDRARAIVVRRPVGRSNARQRSARSRPDQWADPHDGSRQPRRLAGADPEWPLCCGRQQRRPAWWRPDGGRSQRPDRHSRDR